MRLCPLCNRGARDGEDLDKVRVAASDFTPEVLAKLKRETPGKAGLYHSCRDCTDILKPEICKRVNAEHGTEFTPETLPGNYLV